MSGHLVPLSLIVLVLRWCAVGVALERQPLARTPRTRRDTPHLFSQPLLSCRQQELHCREDIISNIILILSEQDPTLNLYITDEGLTEEASSNSDFRQPTVKQVMETAASAAVPATVVQQGSHLCKAVQRTGITNSVVIVMIPIDITSLFRYVYGEQLGDRLPRWLVLAEGGVPGGLEEVLQEETQVLLVVQHPQGVYELLTSHINDFNQVRFEMIAICHERHMHDCVSRVGQTLFPSPLKVYQNFRGRQLLVATVDNVPYFRVIRWPNGTVEPGQGVDYNVIHTISHSLNFTIHLVVPEDRAWGSPLPNGSVNGMVGLVAHRLAHVALNELTITELRTTVVDFTQPYVQEGTALISRAPKEQEKLLAVFSPFSLALWAVLFMVTLLMGILSFLLSLGHDCCTTAVPPPCTTPPKADLDQLPALCSAQVVSLSICITKNASCDRNMVSNVATCSCRKTCDRTQMPERTLSKYCFNIFRTLVLQGNLMPDCSSPIRAFLFTWYAFCIILYAMYSGSLTSYLTKPILEKSINSLQDLIDATRRGFVPAVQPTTNQEGLFKNANSGIFHELWELMDPKRSFPKSGRQAMEKVLTEDIVYMSGGLNLEIRASQKGRQKFYISRETFLPQLYGIACFRGAPFKEKFSIILGRMVEAGLVAKWVEEEVYNLKISGRQQEQQPGGEVDTRPLTLDHLQGAFIILVGGSLISSSFFLLERLKHQATASQHQHGCCLLRAL